MAAFTPDPAPAGGGFTPDAPTSKPFSLARAGESAMKTGRVALGLDEPKSLADAALQLMTTMPLTAAGGALLKGAPALGRILASGALGAGQEMARGGSAGQGAVKDAGAAALAEGVASLIGHGRVPLTRLSLWRAGAPARGYAYATRAPAEALEKIRGMLPQPSNVPWMHVPALSSSPLTPDQAIKKLVTLEGNDYRMVYEQIVAEFNAFGKAGTGPKAGDFFREFTSGSRFRPSSGSRAAETTRRALVPDAAVPNPPLRSGLDALSSMDVQGVPIGPAAALGLIGAAPPSLGSLVSHFGR